MVAKHQFRFIHYLGFFLFAIDQEADGFYETVNLWISEEDLDALRRMFDFEKPRNQYIFSFVGHKRGLFDQSVCLVVD